MASTEMPTLVDVAMATTRAGPADFLIVLPVAVSMLFGAGLLMIRERTRLHGPIAIFGLGAVFAVDLGLLAQVASGGPRTMMMGAWKPPFGVAFTADLMGALFLAVAGLAALACGIHAVAAVPSEERRFGFFPFMFLMTTGVSGAFLTGDVFNLYVWFEVLLIGSFGLLVLGSSCAQLDGATKYAFPNLVATTLFLIATGFLYGIFGTLNMADIAVKAAARGPDAAVSALAVLYLVAFSMKAAAFPLNAWLPASYHTPRFAVSALFAGLLTKVGIYAMIRVLGMLFPPERAGLAPLIGWIAGLTMVVGALGALAQSDIRRLLNYLVISGIGTIMAGLAMPAGTGPDAPLAVGLTGAILYSLHSIVAMTALYLAGGVAARRAGSSSLHEMGGLWKRFPGFSLGVLVLLFAASGLPPFSGFWPKLLLIRASLSAGMPWLASAILVSGFLITLACSRVFALAFWRPLPDREERGEREDLMAPMPCRAASAVPILGLLAVVVMGGLLPEWPMRLSARAAGGIMNPAAYIASVFGGSP